MAKKQSAGQPTESEEPTIKTTLDLPKSLHKRIVVAALDHSIPRRTILVEGAKMYLAMLDKKKAP